MDTFFGAKLVVDLAEFGDKRFDQIVLNLNNAVLIVMVIINHNLIKKEVDKRSDRSICKKQSVRHECRECPGKSAAAIQRVCQTCFTLKCRSFINFLYLNLIFCQINSLGISLDHKRTKRAVFP